MTQMAVSSIKRRGDVEQQEIEHHVDALGAALDDLGQAAGAPLEVEAQRQVVDVAEDPRRQPPARLLADLLEHGVAQIVGQHAGEARRRHKRRPARATIAGAVGRAGHASRPPLCRRRAWSGRWPCRPAPAARRRRPGPSARLRLSATATAGSGRWSAGQPCAARFRVPAVPFTSLSRFADGGGQMAPRNDWNNSIKSGFWLLLSKR